MKCKTAFVAILVPSLLLMGTICSSLWSVASEPTSQPAVGAGHRANTQAPRSEPDRNGQAVDYKTLEVLQTEQRMRFVEIPGPDPILVPGGPGDWDGLMLEASGILKDENTYYLYYHARPKDHKAWKRTGYRLGVATAPHPLGPWTKYQGNPILDLGPKGSWDDGYVACGNVIKEGQKSFYMVYTGNHSGGLAYAGNPLGPWKKFERNPIIKNVGYVGGLVKVGGTYHLYAECPVGASSPDQGPFALSTAAKLEGPWKWHEPKTVLPAGDWGAWDDGGFSEAGVLYHDRMFHCFYGGTKWQKLESIGYAWSLDGVCWHKHHANPVIPRENQPGVSAYAEVHALWEPPFYYVYHTMRYRSRPIYEDLGVTVLATQTPVKLAMPVLGADALGAGQSTDLGACSMLCLRQITQAAITVETTSPAGSQAGLKVGIRASADGLTYDTEDWQTFELPVPAGETARKTFEFKALPLFAKVVVRNAGPAPVKNVKVTATLGLP